MSNSVNEAINYFITKKFGFLAAAYSVMANLDQNNNSQTKKYVADFEAYKQSLLVMPENELLTLHKDSLVNDAKRRKQIAINEENVRFYNLQSANADHVHWSKAAHWSIDEATALSFGKEPEIVTWKKIEPLKDKTIFAKEFSKRRDLAIRAARSKKFGDAIAPSVYIGWAKELHIELPIELVNEVTKIDGISTNWHEQYLKLKVIYDEILIKSGNTQKSESIRKTENLLQALACIAIDEYGYVPESEKSTAPKEIADALNRQGKTVDSKTIRNWLKEGLKLLPSKPHKD